MNDYRDTDKEARERVRRFKHTLPRCVRKTVRYLGTEIIIGPEEEKIFALFEDENGAHRIPL